MGKQAAPITEQDAFSMDALTLAYMGDVVWSLFIRDTLIHTGIYQVQILSTLTSEIVSARWQSQGMQARKKYIEYGTEECDCRRVP